MGSFCALSLTYITNPRTDVRMSRAAAHTARCVVYQGALFLNRRYFVLDRLSRRLYVYTSDIEPHPRYGRHLPSPHPSKPCHVMLELNALHGASLWACPLGAGSECSACLSRQVGVLPRQPPLPPSIVDIVSHCTPVLLASPRHRLHNLGTPCTVCEAGGVHHGLTPASLRPRHPVLPNQVPH